MKYRYVTERENYEDFAAGRVIISQAGATSFPVRLASEIFQRCKALLPQVERLRLYDPCCGGGYLLTILGFLHAEEIMSIYGSDIDASAVDLAKSNLSLLHPDGLQQRQKSIKQMAQDYGKQSHLDALNSADNLLRCLPQHPLQTDVWIADAAQVTMQPNSVDLLITDLPYGKVVSWMGEETADPARFLLEAQYAALIDHGLATIISDKRQKPTHPAYKRILHDTLGKRRITILQKS